MNRLKYISSYLDRHGKTRWKFRRKGYNSVHLHGEFGSGQFLKEYSDAMTHKLVVGEGKVHHASIGHLIITYYSSSDFKCLAKSTQTVYRRVLNNFRDEHGAKSVAKLERRHIRMFMDKMNDSPSSANRLLSLLSILLDIALDLEWVKTNHARTIKKVKYKSSGFTPWTVEEQEKFVQFYPSGSRERLAYYLYLYTAQRGSDVVRMSRADVKDGRIRVVQQKTGQKLLIPLHPELKKELALHTGELMFILTEYGKPFSTKGFQQWFSKIVRRVGIENRSGHGLRKVAAQNLADAGCSAHEIMAITGHKTLSEVTRYTQASDQKKLAEAAIATLEKSENV